MAARRTGGRGNVVPFRPPPGANMPPPIMPEAPTPPPIRPGQAVIPVTRVDVNGAPIKPGPAKRGGTPASLIPKAPSVPNGRPATFLTNQQKAAEQNARYAILVDLAKSGATFRQIAQQLGYASPSAAYTAFQLALKMNVRPNAEEALDLMQDRLDGWIFALATKCRAGDINAIRVSAALEAQRAQLLGLNAPVAARIDIEPRLRTLAEQLGLDPDQALATAREIVSARKITGQALLGAAPIDADYRPLADPPATQPGAQPSPAQTTPPPAAG